MERASKKRVLLAFCNRIRLNSKLNEKTCIAYRLQNSDTKKGTLMLISIPCKMASGMASLPE